MRKLIAVVRREYLERVRTRWFIMITLLGPLFLSALLFLPQYLAKRNKASGGVANIVVLDATGTGMGERFRDALRVPIRDQDFVSSDSAAAGLDADRADVRVIAPGGLPAAERAAVADVMAKRREGYLVLDARTVAGDSARYAGRNASSVGAITRLQTAVRQAVLLQRLEAAGVSTERARDLTTRARVQLATERITDRGRGGSGTANLALAFSTSFLLYMTIVLYGQSVLRGVLEEKTTRVAEVVVSSVRPETLMAGKVLGVGAVGLTQLVIWVGGTMFVAAYLAPFFVRPAAAGAAASGGAGAALAAGVLDQISPSFVALFLLFFLLGYTFYAALNAAAGSMVNSEQEAQQVAQPIIFMLVASALLIQPVVLNPASGLARVASLVPLSAPIIMPLRASLTVVPWWEMALSVGLLVLGCIGAVWIAARIYRTGILMYGKRPSLGELMRWVRQSV